MKPNSEGISPVKLQNSTETTINPATDETVAEIADAVGAPSTIGTGRKTVASAGTAEAIGASTSIRRIIITALEGNTGVIVVGGSAVVASLATRTGVPLFPNQAVDLLIDNLSKVYVDVMVNGEGVSYTYFV